MIISLASGRPTCLVLSHFLSYWHHFYGVLIAIIVQCVSEGVTSVVKLKKNFWVFNNPKKHGHSVKPLDIPVVEQKLVQVEMMLDRKYMESSHMKPFCNMMRTVCDSVSKYLEYCDSQKQRVYTLHQRFYRGRRPIN